MSGFHSQKVRTFAPLNEERAASGIPGPAEREPHGMKIIVPMAGMGKRMRPHTHTTAKPLLPIAGKPIVQRLVEDLAAVAGEPVEEVAFVINPAFGVKVENELVEIAKRVGAKGSIHYQDVALGTAHAILCAESALNGRVIVAFADTLFRAQLRLDKDCDGVI